MGAPLGPICRMGRADERRRAAGTGKGAPVCSLAGFGRCASFWVGSASTLSDLFRDTDDTCLCV